MTEPGGTALARLEWRLETLEKDRIARLETNAAMKGDLDRERDARIASDLRLEDAIKEMKADIHAIKNSTTWALRTVAGGIFLTILSILVSIATKGTP